MKLQSQEQELHALFKAQAEAMTQQAARECAMFRSEAECARASLPIIDAVASSKSPLKKGKERSILKVPTRNCRPRSLSAILIVQRSKRHHPLLSSLFGHQAEGESHPPNAHCASTRLRERRMEGLQRSHGLYWLLYMFTQIRMLICLTRYPGVEK